jgi:hypothetical protein
MSRLSHKCCNSTTDGNTVQPVVELLFHCCCLTVASTSKSEVPGPWRKLSNQTEDRFLDLPVLLIVSIELEGVEVLQAVLDSAMEKDCIPLLLIGLKQTFFFSMLLPDICTDTSSRAMFAPWW